MRNMTTTPEIFSQIIEMPILGIILFTGIVSGFKLVERIKLELRELEEDDDLLHIKYHQKDITNKQ